MPIDFGYAQARAQARQGNRLPPAQWRTVETATDLARYISALRGTALAPIVQHFPATASPHAIERHLRHAWRVEVGYASRWVPGPWRDSVAWTAWLSELDAIGYLLEGKPALPWMQDDPVLGEFALPESDERRRAIESAVGELPTSGSIDPAAWWYEQWLERLPIAPSSGAGLQELTTAVQKFRSARKDEAPRPTAAEDPSEELERRVIRLLHRRIGEPVVVFCHLVLSALELSRIRGGLVRRALFNANETRGRP